MYSNACSFLNAEYVCSLQLFCATVRRDEKIERVEMEPQWFLSWIPE